MKNYTTFKHPYLLIEDGKGKYQPIYKEFPKELPTINLSSPTLCCPFTTARRGQRPKKRAPHQKKPGYCEICYCRFSDYLAHVRTREHRDYAIEPENYARVDAFISELSRELAIASPCPYDELLLRSPCDRLEAEFSQNPALFSTPQETESLLRFSEGPTDGSNNVPFDIILNNIEKKYSQEK